MKKPKLIPQWEPTQEVRDYLEEAVKNSNSVRTITGYIKQLVVADMDKNKRKQGKQ